MGATPCRSRTVRGRIVPFASMSTKRVIRPERTEKRYAVPMSDAFLDRLAGPEKQRVLKRLRSPEAYERLREKVKGPEDLEKELDRAERMAELHFALESNVALRERAKEIVAGAAREGGVESVAERADTLTDEVRSAIAEGRFRIVVAPDPETNEDTVAILPEGNVSESVPVTGSLAESCVSQLTGNA